MRTAFLGSTLLALAITGVAQNVDQSQQASRDFVNPAQAPKVRQFTVDVSPLTGQPLRGNRKFAARNLAEPQPYAVEVSPGPCFTMRSYLFSPGTNADAPHPIGYTTCTPANQGQMRQTKRPRARFLPQ